MEMVAIVRNPIVLFFTSIVLCMQIAYAASGGARHGGKISRAQFATKMEQREPVDDVIFVDDESSEIFFFSEVLYMTGHKVVHRWEHEGREVSRVTFDIGGPRWRVFSRKTLDQNVKGKWTVLVTDEDGWPLASKVFVFGEEHKNKHLDKIMIGANEESAKNTPENSQEDLQGSIKETSSENNGEQENPTSSATQEQSEQPINEGDAAEE